MLTNEKEERTRLRGVGVKQSNRFPCENKIQINSYPSTAPQSTAHLPGHRALAKTKE